MKNDEIDKVISERVNRRMEELRSLSPDELRKLPPYAEEHFEVGGKPQVLGVYRDPIENGEVLIVVQCKNTRYLGFGYMVAKGFVVNVSGQLREAEEKLMWEYV